MSEEIEKKIQSMEQKQLEHEKQLGEHNNRIKKAEIIQKREETNKNSRSIVITPFDGDRKNYAKYKSSIVDFITNASMICSAQIRRTWKVWLSGKIVLLLRNGVKILPLFTEAQRMNHKRKVQEREDALFERLSNKRKVGVGEQQKGTK
uniref:Uncharacterized protein n=1 Tax=Ditylenchus dipsaci TaxID=166011 RepID=A0A915E057_9BILA